MVSSINATFFLLFKLSDIAEKASIPQGSFSPLLLILDPALRGFVNLVAEKFHQGPSEILSWHNIERVIEIIRAVYLSYFGCRES